MGPLHCYRASHSERGKKASRGQDKTLNPQTQKMMAHDRYCTDKLKNDCVYAVMDEMCHLRLTQTPNVWATGDFSISAAVMTTYLASWMQERQCPLVPSCSMNTDNDFWIWFKEG